jgi:hypothetical protein
MLRVFNKDSQQIMLCVLFGAMANGDNSAEIRGRFNLSRKIFSTVRGAFVAANPEKLKDLQRSHKTVSMGKNQPQKKQLRFLVDECVPPAITLYVSRYLGWATHIQFEEMSGTKDPDVDRYAFDNKFDAIFTIDKARAKGKDLEKDELFDLTDLAFARAIKARHAEKKGDGYRNDVRFKHPVMVRIEGRKDWDNVRNRIRKHAKDLEEAIVNRTSPLIILTSSGVVYGPTYQDIFHEARKPSEADRPKKKSNRLLVNKWIEKAQSSNGKPLSRRHRQGIRKQCLAYLQS